MIAPDLASNALVRPFCAASLVTSVHGESDVLVVVDVAGLGFGSRPVSRFSICCVVKETDIYIYIYIERERWKRIYI